MARRLIAAGLAWLAASAAAANTRIVLDYTAVGDFSEPFSYYNCGVGVRGSDDLNVNAAFGGPGIAVEGGNDGSFDAGETLDFNFLDDVADQLVTATEVSYVASVAPGTSDGDVVPAELSIEAFGAGNVSLGTQPFSGTGEQSVSAAFGDEPIERLLVTASPDSVRIERIAYTVAPGTGIRVNWVYGGAYQAEQLDLCGVTLVGSNTLSVEGHFAGGVGVVGGFGGGQPDTTIDTGETLEVAFAEPRSDVAFHMSSYFYVTIEGGVEFDIEAFDAQDLSVGSVNLKTDVSDVPVSDSFGGATLSRFVIESSPGGDDGLQVGFVSFLVPEPGVAVGGLAALGTVAGIARVARARRWDSPVAE